MKTHVPLSIPRATLTEDHHYRTPAGKLYPSVTTILGSTKDKSGLEQWRERMGKQVANYIMSYAADMGTKVHQLNEDYLNGKEQKDYGLFARAHFENFLPQLNKIDMIHGTEVPLYSDEMRIAGMADCIAEYDGVLSIIDYKTKRARQEPDWIIDYYLQTSAYCMMLKTLSGIEVNQCVIIVSSEQDTMQVFKSNPREYAAPFLLRLEQYDLKEMR